MAVPGGFHARIVAPISLKKAVDSLSLLICFSRVIVRRSLESKETVPNKFGADFNRNIAVPVASVMDEIVARPWPWSSPVAVVTARMLPDWTTVDNTRCVDQAPGAVSVGKVYSIRV